MTTCHLVLGGHRRSESPVSFIIQVHNMNFPSVLTHIIQAQESHGFGWPEMPIS